MPVKTPSVQHMSIIKRRDEWETPPKLFAQACADFHMHPTLDVCATNKSKLCKSYLGLDHKDPAKRDALKTTWKEDFFMNAPYSRIAEFIEYAFAQAWENKVNGLIITHNKTDTRWWHKFIENKPHVKAHFIPGRVQFLLNGLIPMTCANKKCLANYAEEIKKCKKCGSEKFRRNGSPYPSVWIVINHHK